MVRLRNQLNISQHATIPIIHRSNNLETSNSTEETGDESLQNSSSFANKNSLASNTSLNKLLHKRSQLKSNKLNAMDESTGDEYQATALPGEEENEVRNSLALLHLENNALKDQVTTLVNTLQNSDQGTYFRDFFV